MNAMPNPSGWDIKHLLLTTAVSAVLFAALTIYVVPRVIMRVAQYKLSTVEQITDEGKAPLNQISHTHRLATADDRVIVRPNNDTFYSSAWLDLSRGPLLLNVPAMGERYYSLQIMDAWSNAFAYVGKRATGSEAGAYAITGPGWAGKLPDGVKQIQSPTNTVWIIGRTMVYGPADVSVVAALQAQITLTPLAH
jgi:hypothetical protein